MESPLDQARDRLAVAVDVPTLDQARGLIEKLEGVPGWLKVGSELFTAAGPEALEAAADPSGRVFLDVKFHDIPNTVAGAVAAATRHGVGMLTLHAAGGLAMLRAAREAAEDAAVRYRTARPLLVAVTVLTSLDEGALARVGVAGSVGEQVDRLVGIAREAELDGVVASPREAARVRAAAGDRLWIVTPGIRPSSAPGDDQERTARAGEAIQAGADLLVVGRPILSAPDPASAARGFVHEIEEALAARGT